MQRALLRQKAVPKVQLRSWVTLELPTRTRNLAMMIRMRRAQEGRNLLREKLLIVKINQTENCKKRVLTTKNYQSLLRQIPKSGI